MIVFVGMLYSPEDEKRIQKYARSSYQAAAHTFQSSILDGIRQVAEQSVQVVNCVPMGSFPKYSRLLYEKGKKHLIKEVLWENCAYINLPLVKQLQKANVMYKKIKQIIETANEEVTIVAYSLYGPYLKALKKLKEDRYQFKYILIVPDLPGKYGLPPEGFVRNLIEKKCADYVLEATQYADAYVFLTEPMNSVLNTKGKPYTVIEGVYNDSAKESSNDCSSLDIKRILYTGTIDNALGLQILLDAFEKIPYGSAQLIIAGNGKDVPTLEKRCQSNQYIHYLGFVSKEEVHRLQSQASILVNPRLPEEYTKYSFPSKTMEYLSSGKPVVMNRLPGIPLEYHEHLYFTDKEDAEGLASKLMEVIQTEEELLKKRGDRAIKFISEQKNDTVQAHKIMELIELL